jgi:hypothetical protein
LESIDVQVSEDGAEGSETTLNSDRSHRQKETVLTEARKTMKLEKRPNSSLSQAEMKALIASAKK